MDHPGGPPPIQPGSSTTHPDFVDGAGDDVLGTVFRQAATSVTELYKKAQTQNRRAYRAGYQRCLEDFAGFLAAHLRSSSDVGMEHAMDTTSQSGEATIPVTWDQVVRFVSYKQQQLEQYAPTPGNEQSNAQSNGQLGPQSQEQPATSSHPLPHSGSGPNGGNGGAHTVMFSAQQPPQLSSGASQLATSTPQHLQQRPSNSSIPTNAFTFTAPGTTHQRGMYNHQYGDGGGGAGGEVTDIGTGYTMMDSDSAGGIGFLISPDSLKRRLLGPGNLSTSHGNAAQPPPSASSHNGSTAGSPQTPHGQPHGSQGPIFTMPVFHSSHLQGPVIKRHRPHQADGSDDDL